MLRRGLTRALLFSLLMAVFLSGCSEKPQKKELTRLTLAFQEWVGYGLFYLAWEKNFFANEGIDLVFVDEQLDSARREAFKQGMLDLEAGTLDQLVSKAAHDTPVVAVMELDQSDGMDAIVVSEKIKTFADLAGKKVALATDDVGETFLSILIYERGLSFEDVKIVSEDPGEVAQAFLDGRADACVTWEPHVTQALQRPGAHLLTSTKDRPGLIINTLNVRRDLVQKDPELVKKIMRGWLKAVAYYKEQPLVASKIIAKYYNISPEEYRRQVKGMRWEGYEKQNHPEKGREWLRVFNANADIKFMNRRISRKPDASKAIDRTLLEKLYEDRP